MMLRRFVFGVWSLAVVPGMALTVQVGGGGGELVAVGEEWRYFKGTVAPSSPLAEWRGVEFDDGAWLTGDSGFGYDDGDDETVLDDMEDGYRVVYVRKGFSLAEVPDGDVELVVDYDDGFVAYLNGVEVARSDNMDGRDVANPGNFSSHEAGTAEVFSLGAASSVLQAGANVLAIEGHNGTLSSSDFSLIPSLRVVAVGTGSIVPDGTRWVVRGESVGVGGVALEPGAAGVRVNGTDVDHDGENWSGDVALVAGVNRVVVEVVGVAGEVLASETVEVVGLPAANVAGGVLGGDATWSGAVLLESDVTVPAGVTLRVEAGTVVMSSDGVELVVNGRLLAEGEEGSEVRFTHFGDGTTWGRILMVGAEPCLMRQCVVEFSDCEGDHKDYYQEDCDEEPPGGRVYFQAVVAVACHVDIENCLFENLPDTSGSAEGDAIAIIGDDRDVPGIGTATIRGCRFIGIGQGVHTRYAPVVVRDCFFTGHNGDNDDIDLYGESDPVPLILNNLMVNPGHDDMINPTRCSAIIVGNVIAGSDDHGIVLRDKCRPILINNLIYDCSAAAIAVQNQCDALLINNTMVNCGRGIRLFDHTGRRGVPYCLFPGSGKATLINCIIRDCGTPFDLADSPWEGDMGSHVTVRHCIVDGGEGAADVSANSTLTWGAGNVDVNPLFVDEAGERFKLRSLAGRWDELAETWVTDAATSPAVDAGVDVRAEFPELAVWLGQDFEGTGRALDGDGDGAVGVDLGAFEMVAQAADSRGDGIADGWLFGHGLDVADEGVGGSDGDKDGATVMEEWAALTDPGDAGSVFAAAVRDVVAGTARVEFRGEVGRFYALLRSRDLVSWEVVVEGVAGTGGVDVLEDAGAEGDGWFYRVRVGS